ncbi:MAG: FkbM family methyltransferase [Erythrobacter sp.]|nr:FkbM family methyltransferase [Erythrobacter sp.]
MKFETFPHIRGTVRLSFAVNKPLRPYPSFELVTVSKALPVILRIARRLRSFRLVRGGLCVARAIVPRYPGRLFTVENGTIRYECDLSSYIEWNLAVFGDYEGPEKRAFGSLIPPGRKNIMLDVGANVGAHSLFFAKLFERVVAFEPNPDVFGRLERNITLNPQTLVEPHCIGLSDHDAELVFYKPAYENQGTGTFDRESAPVHYDLLKLPVTTGDSLVYDDIGRVDAIKVDVQGFEPQVLAGLCRTLCTSRPIVWIEISSSTREELSRRGGLSMLLPSGYRIFRFNHDYRYFMFHRIKIEPVALDIPEDEGDFLLIPEEWPNLPI